MSNNQGWIQLHRKIQDKGYYTDSQYIHLWIHLLLRANHKDNEFKLNGKIVPVKRGSFYTSRKQLSIETGIDENKIERILKCFKTEHQIEQQSFTFNRLIIITSYAQYQKTEHQIEQQMNSDRTANEQRLNTDNNDNNNNNDKNENIISSNEEKEKGQKEEKPNFPLTETEAKKIKDPPDEQKKSSTLPENPKQWTDEQIAAHPVPYLFRVYLFLYQERYQHKPALTKDEYAQFGANLKRLLVGCVVDGIDMPKLTPKELKSMFIQYFRGNEEYAQKTKHSFNLLISGEMLRKLRLKILNRN